MFLVIRDQRRFFLLKKYIHIKEDEIRYANGGLAFFFSKIDELLEKKIENKDDKPKNTWKFLL